MLLRFLLVALCAVTTLSAFAAGESFRLVYESKGSEYPAVTRITLDQAGAYVKEYRVAAYAGDAPRWERVSGRLPAETFAKFKAEIQARGFFGMPASVESTRPLKMDCATQSLEITVTGRTHKIGGYDAMSFDKYKGVLQLVEGLEKKLVDKKTEKLPK